MTYSNGFRAYELAIISGLLASGETTDSIRSQLEKIRETAREFSGDVSDAIHLVGVHRSETFAAKGCLCVFLSVPRSLSCAVAHLQALGFSESVARYAYRYLLSIDLVTMRAIDGVAMLSSGGAYE